MNIFKILKPIMGLFGWKQANTVLRLPEPLKIVVKRINNCKAMIVAKDPKKTALAVYVPLPDCKTDFFEKCLLIVVAWTVILVNARLAWLWMKNWLMSKRMEKEKENYVPLDVKACKDDAFFDCQLIEETVLIDFDEENICYNLQSENDFQYDSNEVVFFDCQSIEETVLIDFDEEKNISFYLPSENDFQYDSTEVLLDLGSDKKEAALNLESQEKSDFLGLESDEKNGFLDSNSNEDGFPVLPSDLKSEKEFLDIQSEEERIPSLPPDKDERLLPLESEEKGLPDEQGSPNSPTYDVKMLLCLESEKETIPDLSSDKEEKDLPSDEKGSPDLLPNEVEMLLYLESKKERFPDLSSDDEERFPSFALEEKDLPSDEEDLPYLVKSPLCSQPDEEEFKKEGFPDMLCNNKRFSDMTSDEQEIFLYFKSKEKCFPDLPSDEENMPNLPFDKKVKSPFLITIEDLCDLSSNQEEFLYVPAPWSRKIRRPKSKEKCFPDLPSDEEKIHNLPFDKKVKRPFVKTIEELRELSSNQEEFLYVPAPWSRKTRRTPICHFPCPTNSLYEDVFDPQSDTSVFMR